MWTYRRRNPANESLQAPTFPGANAPQGRGDGPKAGTSRAADKQTPWPN